MQFYTHHFDFKEYISRGGTWGGHGSGCMILKGCNEVPPQQDPSPHLLFLTASEEKPVCAPSLGRPKKRGKASPAPTKECIDILPLLCWALCHSSAGLWRARELQRQLPWRWPSTAGLPFPHPGHQQPVLCHCTEIKGQSQSRNMEVSHSICLNLLQTHLSRPSCSSASNTKYFSLLVFYLVVILTIALYVGPSLP